MNHSFATAPRKFLPLIKAKLREKVPKLNEKQLKRLRMPIQEALVEELEELNHKKALEVFRKILEIDEKQGKNFTENKNKKLLQKIFNFLKEIEGKSNEEEIEMFLKIMNEIWGVSRDFDWLIELFLLHSSEIIEKFKLIGSKIDAIVKFTHAKALSQRLQWYRPAIILLESAFELSSSHEDWNLQSDQLCVLISLELSNCLTKLSQKVRKDEKDVEGALKLSRRSLKVLRKYFSEKRIIYEIEAEFEYANCYFEMEDFENSLNHFKHALELAEVEKNKKKSCEALVKIAECYKSLNNFQNFENYLLIAKDLAKELKNSEIEGEIYLKLGEHFLQTDDFEKISTYLKAAVRCFNESKNFHKMTQTKSIFAEVKAKNTFNILIDTILRSDKSKMGKNRDYEKLALWYDRKYPLTNRHHEFYRIADEDHDLNVFIKKYYDPDEIIKIQ